MFSFGCFASVKRLTGKIVIFEMTYNVNHVKCFFNRTTVRPQL